MGRPFLDFSPHRGLLYEPVVALSYPGVTAHSCANAEMFLGSGNRAS